MKYIKKPITDITNNEDIKDRSKYTNIKLYVFKAAYGHKQSSTKPNYLSLDLFLADLNSICIEYNYIIYRLEIIVDGMSDRGDRCYADIRFETIDKEKDSIEYEDVAEYHVDHFKNDLLIKSNRYKAEYNISESCPVYCVVFQEYIKRTDVVCMRIFTEIW